MEVTMTVTMSEVVVFTPYKGAVLRFFPLTVQYDLYRTFGLLTRLCLPLLQFFLVPVSFLYEYLLSLLMADSAMTYLCVP